MTESNSAALRGALARAIKSHVDENGLNGVKAAVLAGIANSRMSTILRGQVEKVSSDALVDILGTLGYRLDSVIGATEGHEFTLTLDEGLGLPKDIEAPVGTRVGMADVEPVANVIVHENEDGRVTFEGANYMDSEESDPDANRVSADE